MRLLELISDISENKDIMYLKVKYSESEINEALKQNYIINSNNKIALTNEGRNLLSPLNDFIDFNRFDLIKS